ncbi:MAG TPA: dolichol kinase [Halococcus sp.]|nr:dolichol kinase [Halococcus sp.]
MSEVARRAVHVSGTVFPVAYLAGLISYNQLRWLYIAGSVVALGLEILRLRIGLDWRIYEALTRTYEQSNLAGYALYVFSSTAVVCVFAPEIAVPAVLMLTIADPISGLLGSSELRARKKVSVLSITFVVCFLLAIPFVPPVPAALGAAAATLADGMKPVVWGYVIDDNLSIPIVAALAIAVGLWLSGGVFPFGGGWLV